MRERNIPELLLKCCGKLHKPFNIVIFENHVEFRFFCSRCGNRDYLEYRKNITKRLDTIDNEKFRYIKKGEINGKK